VITVGSVRRMTLAMVVVGVAPVAAVAQGKLEITPIFVSYYAAQTITDDADNNNTGVKLRQMAAAGFGGRITYWLTPSLGVEAEGLYTPSGTRFYIDDPANPVGASLGSNVTLGSARVLFRPSRTNLYLLGGVGYLSRAGDFWDFYEDQIAGVPVEDLASISGVIGFGVRAAVTPRVALNVGVEAYFYSLNPQISGADAFNETNMQMDALVTIGVPIAILK
jgi:opacity protein-like surface antigen